MAASYQRLSTTEQMLPARSSGPWPANGSNHPLRARVAALNDADTHEAVRAERSLLRTLRGGCHAPVAAWGRVEDTQLVLVGRVGHSSGTPLLHAQLKGAINESEALGVALAEKLRELGADQIFESVG